MYPKDTLKPDNPLYPHHDASVATLSVFSPTGRLPDSETLSG
jgi:hypothetical protein